jgi:tetratricopeptide (TPR) repeat protein
MTRRGAVRSVPSHPEDAILPGILPRVERTASSLALAVFSFAALAVSFDASAGAAVAAAAKAPVNPALLPFLEAKMLANEGRFSEAREAFSRAVADAPDEPYVRLEYARLLLRLAQFQRPDARRERLEEAGGEAEAALRQSPGNLDGLRVLAEIRVQQAATDAAAIPRARQTLAALLARSPAELEVALTAAQFAMAQGDSADALEILERTRRERPRNPALAGAILETLRQTHAEAAPFEAAVAERLAADPSVIEWRVTLVDARLDALDVEGAQALLDTAPPEQKEEEAWLLRQGQTRLRDADPDGALQAFRSLAELVGADASAENTVQHAALLLAVPDYATAEDFLVDAMAAMAAVAPAAPPTATRGGIDPAEVAEAKEQNLQVLWFRALIGQGKRGEAAAFPALRSPSTPAGTRLRLAAAAASMDEWQLALDVLAPSLQGGTLQDAGEPARRALRERTLGLAALAQLRLGRPEEARRLLASETAPALVARRAEAAWKAGDRRAAQEGLRQLGAGSVDDALAAAETWQRLERPEEALAAARAAVTQRPESTEARFVFATSLERAGKVREAETELRRVLGDDPTFAPALNYLGYLFAEQNRQADEALRLTQRAVAADPASAAYLDSLGWARYRRGDWRDALRILERAARLEPRDGTLWEHVGDARLALADRAGAAEAYRLSLTFEPENPAAVRRKLRQLR